MLPRVQRPIHISLLVGFYYMFLAPIFIAYTILTLIYGVVFTLLTLPWSFYFSDSNMSLNGRDKTMTRVYANQIQTRNATLNRMLGYVKHNNDKRPPRLRFYPHTSKSWSFFAPGIMASGTDYTYPPISEVFAALENCGWKRADIYDLFWGLSDNAVAREELKQIRKRVCRGDLFAHHPDLDYPLRPLYEWTLAPLNMWITYQSVVDVDMESVNWIMREGCILRPKDVKTLRALDTLNSTLGMWKFVIKPEDLQVRGHWQYVVAPREGSIRSPQVPSNGPWG